MRTMLSRSISMIALFVVTSAFAAPFCPITQGSDSIGPPFPRSENWYGGESFAVQLPANGTWLTARDGALIPVKLFWWSAGFRPGMEASLTVEIRSLNDQPMTARVSRPTNAHSDSLGGWTMLTGIEFPDPGCWEISGQYLGQRLSFIVQTVSDNELTKS